MLQLPFRLNSNYYAKSASMPYIDKLIDSLGGEDYLKVIVNAKDFEYKSAHPSLYVPNIVTPVVVEVEFTLGWSRRLWVCGIVWDPNKYTANLRPIPTCRETHNTCSIEFKTPELLKFWLEVKTEFALSF